MGIKPAVVFYGVRYDKRNRNKVPEVAQKAKELVDKWVAEYQK